MITKLKSLKNHQGFMKYFKNTSWLFGHKALSIIISFPVTVWLARYLGPEQFGILNYVIAFIGLFGIFSSLGLSQIITKELLSSQDDSQLTMGSSLVLRLAGGIVLIPIVAYSITVFRPNNELLYVMALILSTTFLFQSFNIINNWFEAHVQAKYSAVIQTIVLFISVILKIVLIFMQAPLIVFIWLVFVESLISAIGLVSIYLLKVGRIFTWKVSYKKIKYLLREAYPLILSGAAYMIFIRIDQIMLGNLVGDKDVGIYAAAVKISESWMFIPTIIASSFFPAMLNARKNNYSLYLQRTQYLLNIMAVLGIVVAICTIFLASPLINLIFGENYIDSSTILIIHIWGMLFIAISIISFRYFIAEGLQIYSFYRSFAGLIINIVLNYLFIPAYGAVGAAVATVISQAVAAYLLNSISPKTRPMFFMQTKALALFGTIDAIKHIKTLRKG